MPITLVFLEVLPALLKTAKSTGSTPVEASAESAALQERQNEVKLKRA